MFVLILNLKYVTYIMGPSLQTALISFNLKPYIPHQHKFHYWIPRIILPRMTTSQNF